MESKLSHQASWKDSVYEVYDKASLPLKWTLELKQTCDDVGIHYFTTPYEISFINSLKDHVVGWKLGSGDITWHDHIRTMAELDMPFLLQLVLRHYKKLRRQCLLLWKILIR